MQAGGGSIVKPAETKVRPGGRTARVTQQIEEVTLAILVEKGYEGLTLKEVAKRAQINRSTLYRRWPSKAALVVAVIQQTVIDNVIFEDTGSLLGDLRAVLLRITTFLGSPIGKSVLAAGLDMQQKGDVIFDDGMSWSERSQEVVPLFERAAQRGEISEALDAEVAFAMVAGALYFRLIVMRGEMDVSWVDRVLETFSNAVLPRESR